MPKSKRSFAQRILIALAVAVVLVLGAFAWYVGDYYHASDVALACVADQDGDADGVTVHTLPGGELAFAPDQKGDNFANCRPSYGSFTCANVNVTL